jgi:predicted secreted protein
MKTKFILLLIVIIAVGILSCKKNLDNTILPIVQITSQDNGKNIAIAQGQTLQINLGNPGDGGYTFDAPQYNSSVLSMGDHTRNYPPKNSPIGDFGSDTWAFRATKTGATPLTITATRGTDKSGTIVMFSGTISVH